MVLLFFFLLIRCWVTLGGGGQSDFRDDVLFHELKRSAMARMKTRPRRPKVCVLLTLVLKSKRCACPQQPSPLLDLAAITCKHIIVSALTPFALNGLFSAMQKGAWFAAKYGASAVNPASEQGAEGGQLGQANVAHQQQQTSTRQQQQQQQQQEQQQQQQEQQH